MAPRKKRAPSQSDSESSSSEDELREAFAKGLLKPGLNVAVESQKKCFKNNITAMKQKTEKLRLAIPSSWIERLDITSGPAPLAPELALQLQEHEDRRAKQAKGNAKLPQYKPGEDPVVNDFKRETMFHRQAQAAVIDGIARIKKLGIPTIRPDDYFAQMAKTDEHMHKVREHLAKKQLAAQRSEKVRQLRQQRKVGKQMQIESTLKKHAEKRKMLDEVKKYRKGVRKDLDFLDDKKKPGQKSGPKKGNNKSLLKQQQKNAKFGFGGKKRGSKLNTRESSADFSSYKRPGKPTRAGKSRRAGMKSKKK